MKMKFIGHYQKGDEKFICYFDENSKKQKRKAQYLNRDSVL